MMKLLVIIAALIGVWTVMRWVEQAGRSRRAAAERPQTRRMNAAKAEAATDTVVCARCGVYVPAGNATACSRADCPFPRRAA
jgi:hypothetical protein